MSTSQVAADLFDTALEMATFAGFGAMVGLAAYGIFRGIDWLLDFGHL